MNVLVVAIVAVLSVLALLGWVNLVALRARRQRRARLGSRTASSEEEWLRQFLPGRQRHCEALVEVLRALERHVGVPWTCLRPEDTFSGTLAAPLGMSTDDEELLEFECFMEDWLKRHRVRWRARCFPDEVGLLLQQLDELLERQRRNGQDDEGQ